MEGVSTNLLDVKYFEPEVLRLLMSATHGLRMAVNNKGILTGSSIRFPLIDIDGIAPVVSKGSDIAPDDLMAEVQNIEITPYEGSCKLFQQDLNATNSAASLRAAAAAKVVHAIENRFTQTILDALGNYDDTQMVVGSNQTPFEVETIDRINLLADNHGWGNDNKFILLPAEAKYTLMQDQKFFEIWSIVNGQRLIDRGIKQSDDNMQIEWTPYRGFMVGFLPKVGRNVVGLPVATDGALMGYAWKASRVGFGMNQGIETRIFEDKTKEGNPIVFKINGSCGAGIIDKEGVIGIKIDPTPIA